jgi:hypothetical protein
MKPKLIYIAGPYTANPQRGVDNQMEVAAKIMNAGHFPYSPLWLHYAQKQSVKDFDYDMCIDHCLHMLPHCDAVLRLPGYSNGADIEVAEALLEGLDLITIDTLDEYLSRHSVENSAKSDLNY